MYTNLFCNKNMIHYTPEGPEVGCLEQYAVGKPWGESSKPDMAFDHATPQRETKTYNEIATNQPGELENDTL